MIYESMPSKEVLEKEEKFAQVSFWYSRFNFLNSTNGLRPKRIHYLLGTTGTGKSTLTSSIVADTSLDSKILVILSEENTTRFTRSIQKGNQKFCEENIVFVSEKNIPEQTRKNQQSIYNWLEMAIVEANIKIVFWDNLTTSPLFTSFGLNGQEWAVLKIRELSEKMGIAFFIVMHTSKGVTDNMGRFIEGEDVRGTQQTFITADFFYIFQRFSVGKNFYPFIRTVKHRGTEPKEKVHLLCFSDGVYLKDSISSFEEMNEIFIQRNVLGKSNSKMYSKDSR